MSLDPSRFGQPPDGGGCKADGGEVISGELVVSGGDAPEVLQSVERILDTPAQLVEALAEAERLLPVAAVGNDRLGPALVQLSAFPRFTARRIFTRNREDNRKPPAPPDLRCERKERSIRMIERCRRNFPKRENRGISRDNRDRAAYSIRIKTGFLLRRRGSPLMSLRCRVAGWVPTDRDATGTSPSPNPAHGRVLPPHQIVRLLAARRCHRVSISGR